MSQSLTSETDARASVSLRRSMQTFKGIAINTADLPKL
jgi:hypothetical protein